MLTINIVTTHPIDFTLLDKLRINKTSEVPNPKLGSILSRLVSKGYKDINVSSEVDEYSRLVIYYHCKKAI